MARTPGGPPGYGPPSRSNFTPLVPRPTQPPAFAPPPPSPMPPFRPPEPANNPSRSLPADLPKPTRVT